MNRFSEASVIVLSLKPFNAAFRSYIHPLNISVCFNGDIDRTTHIKRAVGAGTGEAYTNVSSIYRYFIVRDAFNPVV
jgi:hypothetical protein